MIAENEKVGSKKKNGRDREKVCKKHEKNETQVDAIS